jgi:hypothetical protein
LIRAVEELSHGVDGGEKKLRVIRVDDQDVERGPLGNLACALGLSSEKPHFALLQSVAKEMVDGSYLLLFAPSGASFNAQWQDLVDAVDILSKAEISIRVSVVAFDHSRSIDTAVRFNYNVTLPRCDVFESMDEPEVATWSRYLHQRIAWETGGNIGLAVHFDSSAGSIVIGDDISLEQSLNELAEQQLATVGAKGPLVRYLQLIDGNRAAPEMEVELLRAELVNRGAAWRPRSSIAFEVTPWASRALLNDNVSGQSVFRLRANLICSPIAAELFSLAMRGEAVSRQNLANTRIPVTPTKDATDAQERFLRGEDRYLSYPRGHPSPPTHTGDAWLFASFGEFLNAYPDTRTLNNHKRLKGLRNAIAHCHYVNWLHVKLALQVRAGLAY